MLLLAAALLIVTSAGAQLKSSVSSRMPIAQMKEMKMGALGMPAQPRLNANREAKPYYIRPAGAFTGTFCVETSDPTYTAWPNDQYLYLACKPYTEYTYRSVGDGVNDKFTRGIMAIPVALAIWMDEISHTVMAFYPKIANILCPNSEYMK